SSLTTRMPLSGPLLAASRKAVLTSSADVDFSTTHERATTETSDVGTRSDTPSILPLTCGSTSEVALAAPVVVGMIDIAAGRARRKSLWGKSRITWSLVYEWIVVMKPCTNPSRSRITLTTGTRQFVVQLAFDKTWCLTGS